MLGWSRVPRTSISRWKRWTAPLMGGQLGGEHLDGGQPSRIVGVVGQVDAAHAAAAQLAVQNPAAEAGADHQVPGSGSGVSERPRGPLPP